MRIWVSLLVLFLGLSISSNADAHSGRTDGNGGHNCSDKSIAKGLCSGYHYHNGGGSSSSSSSGSSTNQTVTSKPAYNPKVYYDKGYSEGYAKGRESGYDNGDKNLSANETNADYVEGWDAGYKKGFEEGNAKRELEVKEKKDREDGALDGKSDGKSAYASGKMIDSYTYNPESSEAYIEAYIPAFSLAWEDARLEKSCFDEGYKQGVQTDDSEVTEVCEQNDLIAQFKSGHDKGVLERDQKEIRILRDQGWVAGYEANALEFPEGLSKESYVTAFKEGYDEGSEKRKEEVKLEGYNDAFKQVEFNQDVYAENELLQKWYKDGFAENEIAIEIKETAKQLGEESKEYIIDEKYKVNEDSINLYNSLFEQGQEIKAQRDKEQQNLMLSFAGITAPVAGAGGLLFWNRRRKLRAI